MNDIFCPTTKIKVQLDCLVNEMKLIIVTGMPGAGKSEVADAFRRNGHPIIVMGDVIRKETKRRGLEANRENTKKIALELRVKGGPGAVAKQCIEEWGMRGFKLHPSAGFYPNDPVCFSLYEKCAEWGVPIVFHSGGL